MSNGFHEQLTELQARLERLEAQLAEAKESQKRAEQELAKLKQWAERSLSFQFAPPLILKNR